MVVAAVLGAVVLARRGRDRRPSWAARQVAALDRASASAGWPRAPATPVRRHVEHLRGGPLDHPDLPAAVGVLDRALYGGEDPGDDERRAVEATVADLRRAARPRWRRRGRGPRG